MATYHCVMAVSYINALSNFYFLCIVLTIVTLSVERYLAFRLRLRYRVVVTFEGVVSILQLVSEWIIAALWSGLWFWSVTVSVIFGAVSLISC